MTDRELLEWAAKAAGIRIDKSETNGGGIGNDGFCITGDAMLDWHNNIRWNPLKNDGDALRLAVKLGIRLDLCEWKQTAFYDVGLFVQEDWANGGDPYAATRRAITRAAAEIGKSME